MIDFVSACEKDYDTLDALANEIWHEFFIGIISHEQISYMLKRFQCKSAMQQQVKEDGYEYYLIKKDGCDIGYFAVQPQQDNRLFLSKLYLIKQYRGQGIASCAINFIYDIARKNGNIAVWLTVNKHNDNAISVYKHKGFEVIDSQCNSIGNGFYMDDYYMQHTI